MCIGEKKAEDDRPMGRSSSAFFLRQSFIDMKQFGEMIRLICYCEV